MDLAHLGHVEILMPKSDELLTFFTNVFGMTESDRNGESVYQPLISGERGPLWPAQPRWSSIATDIATRDRGAHDPWNVDRSFHASACRHHAHRDRQRADRCRRDVGVAPNARDECAVPAHDRADKSHRISVSHSRLHAGDRRRYRILRDSGDRAVRLLRQTPRGRVALDLCRHRDSVA